MATEGAGSGRIVLVGAPRPACDERPPRVHRPARRLMQQTGWTIRRLTTAAALGAGAVAVGGLLFVATFGAEDGAEAPLLAAGFGLFVVGMIVLCGALVALLGAGLGAVAARRGWPRAAAFALGPAALAWALLGIGVVGFAIPAVLSLILIAGFVVALR